MKKIVSVMLIVTFMVSGCNGFSLSDNMVTNIGEDTTQITGKIADASTMKQALLEKSRQARDKAYKDTYLVSGLNLEFEMVSIGGTQAYLPKKITFREKPDFGKPVADSPADHPFWAASKSWVHDIVTGWVIVEGVRGLKDVMLGAIAGAGSTYNGPVNMNNSQNKAGGDQTFDGSGQAYNVGDQTTTPEVPEVPAVTP
jgi:hypothetical protein